MSDVAAVQADGAARPSTLALTLIVHASSQLIDGLSGSVFCSRIVLENATDISGFVRSSSTPPVATAIPRSASITSGRPSRRSSDTESGTTFVSSSSAHAASSYGLIVGCSSVSASLMRMSPFMWLSAT